MRTIVLDTNCLLVILPSISPYHRVWEDILAAKTTPEIAKAVIEAILEIPCLKRVQPTYFYQMIVVYPDDNKFVDCAICGNAELLVTNDAHFDVLRTVDFPRVEVIKLQEYVKLIEI